MGVLELVNNIGVEHKTIKKHFEKLYSYGMINIKLLPQNKKSLSTSEWLKPGLLKIKELNKI